MRLEGAVPARVLDAIRAPFLAAGGERLEAPIVQPLGLFLDLAGEAMRERLFIVQSPSGEEACLRPDFTILAAKAHIESGAPRGRYLYEGHAFRVAPPGAGRSEEFLQVGLEVFEDGDPAEADAAMAALAWQAAAAGGRDDLTLLLGDVALFGAFVDSLGLADALAARIKRSFSSPRRLRAELEGARTGPGPAAASGDRLAGLLSTLPEAEAAGVLAEIWALAGIEPVGGRSPAEIAHRLADRAALHEAPRLTPAQADRIARFLAIADAPRAALTAVDDLVGERGTALDAAFGAWDRRLAALASRGVPAERLRLSTAFGRALGYYDGVLFEVRGAGLGPEAPAAAGGRYDGLPGRLGATIATGAVGCVVRPGRAWIGGAP
jgi:ATP phosphoribosyltransferase regulatory subunit